MFVAAVAALAAAFGAGPASAANVQVSLANCYFSHGGQMTVPAGSTVTFFLGFVTISKGAAKSFESAQTTTATLNGSAVPNASSLFAEPVQFGPQDWVAPLFIPGGTLVNAGDQTSISSLQVTLAHQVPSFDRSTQTVGMYEAGDLLPADFGCTVTAA
jgi:hypothetical protein